MWYIGQKVVCVDDQFELIAYDCLDVFPKKGRTYVIRNVYPGSKGINGFPCAGILLVGLNNPFPPSKIREYGYCSWRFRALEEMQGDGLISIEEVKSMSSPVKPAKVFA